MLTIIWSLSYASADRSVRYAKADMFHYSCIIRPLQINSLFPVHRPHLVTASSKYSIIPYSSIIFRLFLHTDRLSKSHLETVSAHVSTVLSSQHKLHVCVVFATYKEGTSLSMLLCSLFGCARQIMA